MAAHIRTLYFLFIVLYTRQFSLFFLMKFRLKHEFISNILKEKRKNFHDPKNDILVFTVVLVFLCCCCFSFKASTAPSMPLMLHNHSSVCWEDSQSIVVLGGGGNCFSFGTHLNDGPVFINLPLPR